MKKTLIIIGLGVIFTLIVITILYFQRTRTNDKVFVQNGKELADIIRNLEELEDEYNQIDMEEPENEVEATVYDNGDLLTIDYSKYIGIWRGYAIAIFVTLVITDVRDDEMTFLFLHMMNADGSPDFTSPIYTMPIIDNQITLVEERTWDCGMQVTITKILTFHDDHISLLRFSGDEGLEEREHVYEWLLRRLPR